MKSRKLETLPLALILFFLCVSISPCLAQFAGGTGSEAAPYLVATAQHLNNVRNYPGAFFLQTDDIYLNEEPYNSGFGWLPIGTQSAPFTGSYNGNNFHIYYLYINQPEGNNLGLFGYAHSAVLKNITLKDVYINGKDYIGALIGSATECFIESCSSEGTITGASVTGGLVGSLELSCHLEKCFANCVVNGQFATGGLCGYSKGASEIYSSFSKGTITGNNATGGLVGMQGNSTISQCFSTSAVQGNWGAGGLLGVNDTQSLVSYCYSLGSVTGNSNTGGLIGRNVVSQTLFSYWNVESSGQTISAGGIGRTADEMTYPYASNTYIDWDLTEIWQPDTQYFVNGGYPYLQWMYPCPPISYLRYQIENYSVILQWSVPYVASYTGFNIYKNGVLYATVTDSIFIDNNVYHQEHYSYQVSAVYLGGESILSEPVSFTVYFPPLPANCVFPANGATYIETLPLLQWSPVAYTNYPLPDGYLLEVMSLAGFSVVNIDVGNVTSYQIPIPLDYETEYYWIVTPYTFGEGNIYLYAEDVPNWYFTTQEQIIKPINLIATIENWKNVQLNWNMEERALQNFNIYRNGTLIGNSYYPSYYDENLSQGDYTYYVTALYETAESEPSNPATVTISYIYPPQNVYAALIDSLLQISWQPSVSGLEQGYIVYRLQEGQEDEEYLWEYIGYTTNGYTFYDYAWQNLPTGNYRWAIKAHFEDDNYSTPAFSNEIIKAPAISIYPTSIYQELTTQDTCYVQINVHNTGNAPLNWNCQIIFDDYVVTRQDKRATNRDLCISITPSDGTLEPGATALCLLEFTPADTVGVYHYDLQFNSNDITNPVIQIPADFVVNSPIAYIPDDNFRMAINDALGQPSDYQPTIADLQGLTGYLYAGGRNIISIEGAQYLTNLRSLNLFYNQISDLSPLAGLTNLQMLDLDFNQISDLSPLAGLTNLQVLGLEGNQISDLSPLAGLTNLWLLSLNSNQISDLSPLAGLINLQELYLYNNHQISDLSPLAGLTNLQVLYLYNNQISDLSPLAGLTNLQDLRLHYNQISDISPLAGMTNLWNLNLDDNPISYESMLLAQSWSLPWHNYSSYYNPLSPCYPDPNRGATNVLVNYPLSWQGNYENSPDVYYEVWLGINPYSLIYQGFVTQMVNTTEHQYCFNITLQENTQYYWRIRAIASADTIWSGMWSFTTGEGYYQPVISVTPTSIYDAIYTAETSQREITITNNGTAPLNWNSNIVLTRAEQKTGTHPCINKEVNIDKELNEGRENTAENRMRQSKEDRQMIRRDGKLVNPLSEYGIDEKTEIERRRAEKRYFDRVNGDRMFSDKFGLEGIDSGGRNANIKDNDRDSTFTMPDIYLSPYSGTIEPNSSVTCILTFIPENTPGTYNYELQLSSNDPVSPLITVPIEYVVNSTTTYIPDDNFRIAINDALGQPSYYQPTISDLNGLTGYLDAWSRNIISIEGAQYLTNLQGLDFSYNQISDLSPLAGLTNLQVLCLSYNQISDLSPLAGLTNLQELYLDYNQISYLSPLAGLTNLQYLYLYYNQISDLSPLAGLTNLQELYLSYNQISNISPLAGLTNLWLLYLYSNQISDISPLAGLSNLSRLYLGYNQISDLSPLAGLTNLQFLYLDSNQISDISPLARLTNLQGLGLDSNQISDISPLAGLTNLQVLSLYNNQISDISPLAGLNNLFQLELFDNQISDLSPLAGLNNLQWLWLDNNPISYESMLLTQSWSLPWSTSSYNPLSPCYPDPNRGATNIFINYPLSWRGNYNNYQYVHYEVWLGISPNLLIYQGSVTQMVNTTEHLYYFNLTLQTNTQYYWRVRVILSNLQIWSGMWSFTTGEGYYQPVIAVTPTSIYQQLTTAETSQREITITNNGTAPLNWNSNIVLVRAEQKTGTHPCINKEVNIDNELNEGRENTAENRMRQSKENRQMLRRDGKLVNPLSEYGIDEKTEIERRHAEKRYFDSVSRDRMFSDKFGLEGIDSGGRNANIKDNDRDSTFTMPDINLSPYSGTIEPNSSVTCILTFIAGNTPGTYNYELQLSSNDPVSPLITVHLEYIVNSPIAYIPDDNFRWAINDALGQPADYHPTIADLQGLTGDLYADDRNIVSIEGAQYLTNLQVLHLYRNQISDLSPLAALTNLQYLDLGGNRISDLSPLAWLINLRLLYLYTNQISDLSPLAGLTNLQELHLSGNRISDLSPLAGLTNLEYLKLRYNQISDISPLVGLTYLQALEIEYNQISDLSPLAGLTNLQELFLYSNQISELSPLAGLTNLQWLYLAYNQISDLSPLAGLNNLVHLWLDDNPISYESMLLAQSWSLPWHSYSSYYNPLSPCYPDPNRGATNVLVNYPLSWQGNYENSPNVYYEVWLGISPDLLIYQGFVTQMVNTTEHLYSFTPILQSYTQYYWRVRVVSATEEIWSGMWSFTTGEEYYQQVIAVTPPSIYDALFTAETSQREITITNNGTAPLNWNSNIVLIRAEQKTGTHPCINKEVNIDNELNAGRENTAENRMRQSKEDRQMLRRDGKLVNPLSEYGIDEKTEIERMKAEKMYFDSVSRERMFSDKFGLEGIDSSGRNVNIKDNDRDSTSTMPDINLSPYSGTIEPNSSVTCILTFIAGNTPGTYNYELQLSFNDPVSPLITVPLKYVVNSPIAYIPDDNFRWAINETLGQPYDYQPTIADLQGLTGDLYADDRNIVSIEGAQYLTNLQEMYLWGNQISDLSPLVGLSNLQELWLFSNQISDLSPLAGLTNLQRLYLGSNQISDISPLAGLTNLPVLSLDSNQISDISPLAGLTNLQGLYLDSNQISDLSPLTGLTNLQGLNLDSNQISDLSPLAGLTNLQYLIIAHNQIINLSPLARMTNLWYLDLGCNQISDLSPLAGLTNLQKLWLFSNQISDLSPLTGLTNLQELYLWSNQISDISPLAGLTNLQELYLGSNQISDLSPLAGLTNMQSLHLHLDHNQISDLSPLAGLTNLRYLELDNNQISDISPLAGLTNLRSLDLNNNPISYESMLLAQSWSLPWHSSTYKPLSPCYPDPNRGATNVLVNYPLSWRGNYNNNQNAYYEVWLGISPNSLIYQGVVTQMVNTTEHLYSFSVALQANTQYYWRVKAISATEQIWSGMWSFTTGNYGAGNTSMLEPVPVTLAINALQNQVRLSWQRRRDEESYYVYWSENPYAEFPEGWNGPVNVTETSFTDTLSDKCFYRVFAVPYMRGEIENKQNTKPRAIMPKRGE